MRNLPILPDQASNFAMQSDALFWVLTLLTLAFTLLVGVLILVLAVRYRRGSKVDRSKPVHTSHILELSWSIGPLLLGLAVFVWAAKLFSSMYGRAPANADEIYVIGKQWMWHLQHTNGIRENNELHVPVGRPVKLTMISQDVIHSFYVPAFRVKRDVIPGRYTSIWFTPTKAGKYHLFCAEYCGTQHSEMGGWVYVMEPTEYQQWLATGGQRTTSSQPIPKTMEAAGAALYEQQGCGNCHDADGTQRGPSLAGLYGNQVKLRNGQTAIADEVYLRKSILEPSEDIADTYQQVMPSYKGQITEEQVLQLIAYIKSLSKPATTPGQAAPQKTATSNTGRTTTAVNPATTKNTVAVTAVPRGN
jgi:cytochrome c oxidase subunit 2